MVKGHQYGHLKREAESDLFKTKNSTSIINFNPLSSKNPAKPERASQKCSDTASLAGFDRQRMKRLIVEENTVNDTRAEFTERTPSTPKQKLRAAWVDWIAELEDWE